MLNREQLVEFLNDKITPILANLGYDLIEVKMIVSHGRKTLQIFIDKPGGVSVEDCAIASREIGEMLDQHDEIFSGRYYLEVSSPGAERQLTMPQDFLRFKGRKALIRYRTMPSKVVEHQGYLEDFADNKIHLRLDDQQLIEIGYDQIVSARLCL